MKSIGSGIALPGCILRVVNGIVEWQRLVGEVGMENESPLS